MVAKYLSTFDTQWHQPLGVNRLSVAIPYDPLWRLISAPWYPFDCRRDLYVSVCAATIRGFSLSNRSSHPASRPRNLPTRIVVSVLRWHPDTYNTLLPSGRWLQSSLFYRLGCFRQPRPQNPKDVSGVAFWTTSKGAWNAVILEPTFCRPLGDRVTSDEEVHYTDE